MALTFAISCIAMYWAAYALLLENDHWVSGINAALIGILSFWLWARHIGANMASGYIGLHDEDSSDRFAKVEAYENLNCRLVVLFVCLGFLSLGLSAISQVVGIDGFFTIQQTVSMEWIPVGLTYILMALVIQGLNTRTSLHGSFVHALNSIPSGKV